MPRCLIDDTELPDVEVTKIIQLPASCVVPSMKRILPTSNSIYVLYPIRLLSSMQRFPSRRTVTSLFLLLLVAAITVAVGTAKSSGTMPKTHYDVLEVQRDATLKDIKKA